MDIVGDVPDEVGEAVELGDVHSVAFRMSEEY